MMEERSKVAIRVEDAIMENDAHDPRWRVDVVAENGVVTLDGAVPSTEDRQKVEAIARRQEGVTSVINEIDVNPDLEENPADLDIDNNDEVNPPPVNPPG
ncbi:BON domain-containing protein [bacterium]|nr:BON domain-containing protein [bacterium]